MADLECQYGCIAAIDCEATPGCNYPDPHFHSFVCDKTCTYCQGQGVPVDDPENHPNHREWKNDNGYWPGKAG